MTLLMFERRWALAILEAFAPSNTREGLVPREGEVDYLAALELMSASSTARARIGIRAALWFVALSPILLGVAFSTMAGLDVQRRARLLDRMLSSNAFIVRELALLMKIAATFALLGTASIRARSGYDRAPKPASPRSPQLVMTKAREPRALPVLRPSRPGAW